MDPPHTHQMPPPDTIRGSQDDLVRIPKPAKRNLPVVCDGQYVVIRGSQDDLTRIPKPAKRNLPVVCDGQYVVLPPAPVKRLRPSLPLQPLSPNVIVPGLVGTSASSVHKACTPAVKSLNENAKNISIRTIPSQISLPLQPLSPNVIVPRLVGSSVSFVRKACTPAVKALNENARNISVRTIPPQISLPLQPLSPNVIFPRQGGSSVSSVRKVCTPAVKAFKEKAKNITRRTNPLQTSTRTTVVSEALLATSPVTQLCTPAVEVSKDFEKSAEACEKQKPVKTSKLSLKKAFAATPISENQDKQRLQEILEQMLPLDYIHKVMEIEPMQPYHKSADCFDQSEMFSATIRLNLRTKEEAEQWLANFQHASLTDWRVRRCFPENTKCIIFKKGYRCLHNTQAQYRTGKKAHAKQTECQAFLYITVKNFNMTKSEDEMLKEMPCEIILNHIHNHPIESADSLRHRRPTNKVVEIFTDMFRKEHSPSSALSTHQYDIQEKHPENWFEILADGSECPNLQWCYHLYRKIFSKEYGPATGQGMVDSLTAATKKYNEEVGSDCAVFKVYKDTDLIFALCTPLMKRVHQHLRSSGEMNFLDSGGCMDRHNSRVFTFLAPSVAGALPLGMIVTSSESEEVLVEGIRMLKQVLPPNAFYGRGPTRGPEVIMTDDSKSERNALERSFPGVVLLLCLFHVLQAFWTYVLDSKHKVNSEHREEVFFMVKEWTYSETVEEFLKRYNEMLAHTLISTNQFVVKQIKGLFARAAEWALCHRNDLLIRGNNTNNYSEITIKQFKDQVLQRVKAYSVVQLFHFFCTRLEAYFERRLAAVVNNRKENYYSSKHFIKPDKLQPLKCEEGSFPNCYVVKNVARGTTYLVDMQLEICSCPVGKNGAPCKHQCAVAKHFKLSSSQFLPYEDEAAKAVLHQIMTDIPCKPGWYAGLKSGPMTSKTAGGLGESLLVDSTLEIEGTIHEIEGTIHDIETDTTPVTCGTSAHLDPAAVAEAKELWQEISSYISNGLEERPDTFLSAVMKFASQFNIQRKLSENAVLSSMHMFAKDSGFGSKNVCRKGRYIKVNTAAVIRRKYRTMKLGGRTATRQGRPPKSAFTGEHGYSNIKKPAAAWNRPQQGGQRRGAMPHRLSLRVSQSHKK